jgi:ribosome-associated translation inhibitor RaiA
MKIQLKTDANVESGEGLADHVTHVVEKALSHVSSHVTRVEVHISDENGAKTSGEDKRCMMEARFEGRQPTAVTHHAGSVHQAIEGAADKLQRLLESTLEKLRDSHR